MNNRLFVYFDASSWTKNKTREYDPTDAFVEAVRFVRRHNGRVALHIRKGDSVDIVQTLVEKQIYHEENITRVSVLRKVSFKAPVTLTEEKTAVLPNQVHRGILLEVQGFAGTARYLLGVDPSVLLVIETREDEKQERTLVRLFLPFPADPKDEKKDPPRSIAIHVGDPSLVDMRESDGRELEIMTNENMAAHRKKYIVDIGSCEGKRTNRNVLVDAIVDCATQQSKEQTLKKWTTVVRKKLWTPAYVKQGIDAAKQGLSPEGPDTVYFAVRDKKTSIGVFGVHNQFYKPNLNMNDISKKIATNNDNDTDGLLKTMPKSKLDMHSVGERQINKDAYGMEKSASFKNGVMKFQATDLGGITNVNQKFGETLHLGTTVPLTDMATGQQLMAWWEMQAGKTFTFATSREDFIGELDEWLKQTRSMYSLDTTTKLFMYTQPRGGRLLVSNAEALKHHHTDRLKTHEFSVCTSRYLNSDMNSMNLANEYMPLNIPLGMTIEAEQKSGVEPVETYYYVGNDPKTIEVPIGKFFAKFETLTIDPPTTTQKLIHPTMVPPHIRLVLVEDPPKT